MVSAAAMYSELVNVIEKLERFRVRLESNKTLRLSSFTSCVRLSTVPALRRIPCKAHSKATAFLGLAPQVPGTFA